MQDYLMTLLGGLAITLQLTAFSLLLGVLMAAGMTWVLERRIPVATQLVQLWVLVFTGTPLLIQIYLIHTGNAQFCTLLGRASHPVYIIRQGMRTVRFDTDILPHPVQAVHKFTVNPERRLSARQYHRHRRIFPHFRQDFLIGHPHTLFMLRVAKRTFQVATGETHKNSRSTRMKALSLQAVKYFVNLPHKRSCQSSS
jgi:hypothetical protein